MEKNIKDYLHLYLGCEIRMFNDVTKEWSNWRKLTPTDLNLVLNYDKKAELLLKNIIDIPFDEFAKIDQMEGNTDIGATDTGFISRPEKVRRYFATTYAIRTLEYTKRGYDLFGLIDAGLAIDKTTLKETTI